MRFLLLLSALSACTGGDAVDSGADDTAAEDTGTAGDTDTASELVSIYCFDEDGDGVAVSSPCVSDRGSNYTYVEVSDPNTYSWDCAPSDAAIYPGQTEVETDGIDNDCDGLVDEESTVTRWFDNDGDTFGNPDMPVSILESDAQGLTYLVSNNTDCDDQNAQVTTGETWVVDSDGDGYGDESLSEIQVACEQPAGFVDNTEDCNDDSDEWFPGAEEDCSVDEDRDCDGVSPFVDADGDDVAACEDCNDADEEVNPDAEEICDDQDNDCDGRIDDNDSDVVGASTWYDDDDSDGYGDALDSVAACDQPTRTVSNDDDCDDGDAAVSPNAREVCDEVDNDCDSLTDDADGDVEDQTWWYYDGDGDGYGDTSDSEVSCDQPVGDSRGEYVDLGSDCDDNDDDVFPGSGC